MNLKTEVKASETWTCFAYAHPFRAALLPMNVSPAPVTAAGALGVRVTVLLLLQRGCTTSSSPAGGCLAAVCTVNNQLVQTHHRQSRMMGSRPGGIVRFYTIKLALWVIHWVFLKFTVSTGRPITEILHWSHSNTGLWLYSAVTNGRREEALFGVYWLKVKEYLSRQ